MKTTRNYLKNTSKHLFQYKSRDKVYLTKITVNSEKDEYTEFTFDSELNLISQETWPFSEYETPAGKKYVPIYIKEEFRGLDDLKAIKHFKVFRRKWEDLNSKLEEVV